MDNSTIQIRGAREHNLQNINLDLPRDRLIVFTGVSGSGKSSLAFDTLYAEGQRRYVESLSSYARQFLGQLQKPDVDLLSGLSPAISIQQKAAGRNPRYCAFRAPERRRNEPLGWRLSNSQKSARYRSSGPIQPGFRWLCSAALGWRI